MRGTGLRDARKRPKELVGHRAFSGSWGFSKLQSLVAAGSLAR
jgi:hypothetical protein